MKEWMKPRDPVDVQRPACTEAEHFRASSANRSLPFVFRQDPVFKQSPQVSIGAYIVEPVVMDSGMGQVRRHFFEDPFEGHIEEFLVPLQLQIAAGLIHRGIPWSSRSSRGLCISPWL